MKTQCLVIAAVLLGFTNPDTSAAADTGVRITVTIRGAASEADAVVLRKTLGGIKGIMVKAESIKAGKKGRFRHYFSPPFVIAIADINKTDIGAIAAKVAGAVTPSRKEIKPSLNLVLFDGDEEIMEEDVVALRTAMFEVNGVEQMASGAIGAVPGEGRYWIRLEVAGGAALADVQAALKRHRLGLKLVKPLKSK
jgi:hypothetical protein